MCVLPANLEPISTNLLWCWLWKLLLELCLLRCQPPVRKLKADSDSFGTNSPAIFVCSLALMNWVSCCGNSIYYVCFTHDDHQTLTVVDPTGTTALFGVVCW